MTDALRFEQVSKRYTRSGPNALDSLSFRIPPGCIAGFVGPNGAGKTTAFSLVSGFLHPDAGHIDILGEGPFDAYRLKGRLGVLPQDADLSVRHTPWEVLVHFCRLQGMSARQARTETERVLAVVRLWDRRDDRIATLSHGMRRRVAVATALAGSPELVLLDEPMAGLDPVQARALRDALSALRGIHTLVVSSHNLLELERLCDWVVMLGDGRCIREGSVAEITGQHLLVEWLVGDGVVPLAELQERLPEHAFGHEGGVLRQEAPAGGDLDASSIVIMEILARATVPVREIRRGVSLEEQFIDDASR